MSGTKGKSDMNNIQDLKKAHRMAENLYLYLRENVDCDEDFLFLVGDISSRLYVEVEKATEKLRSTPFALVPGGKKIEGKPIL